MKLKGVSWIEAHFEKLFVGLMLLVCIGVLVLQFVFTSNTVDVGGREQTLGNAFQPAAQRAQEAIRQMQNEDPALPEFEATADLEAAYRERLASPVTPVAALEPFGSAPDGLSTLSGSDVTLSTRFAIFEPPTPQAPLAVAYRATLDPYEVEEREGLSAVLPAAQPFDTAWVSVELSIDDEAIEAAFRSDPDGAAGEIQPLPTDWWRAKRSILAVEAERQQLQVDGSWSAAEAVGRLPGFDEAVPLSPAPGNWSLLDERATSAGRRADAVLRPGFYGILEGEPWRPPSAVPSFADAERGEDEIRRLERELAGVRNRIEERREALGRVGQTGGDSGRPGGGRDSGGREGGGRQDAGGGNDDQQDAGRRRIEQLIERLEADEASVIERLEALGWTEAGGGVGEQGFDLESWLSDRREANGGIVSWIHDIRLDDGGVYRYRVRLVMANPLFGRAASLAEDLRDRASVPYVRSSWSGWSEPVDAGWSEYFFVESANAGAGLLGRARPTARGELFRFHYGFWRRVSVSLEPGDRFVGEVDLPEGLQVWDTERPAGEQAWRPAEEAEQPEDIVLLPESLAVAADAWLLDVVVSPFSSDTGLGGQVRAAFDAVIRRADGRVSRRSPDVERADPQYLRIVASARSGEAQVPSVPGEAGGRRANDDRFGPDGGRGDRDRGGDRDFPPGGGGG
ncbi:MAG: hypothetical protein AAFR96_05980 [Planctomycetota bacterium]